MSCNSSQPPIPFHTSGKVNKDKIKSLIIYTFSLTLQKVIRLLVERYILDKTSAGGDSEVGVTRADIMGIRNDVAVFR